MAFVLVSQLVCEYKKKIREMQIFIFLFVILLNATYVMLPCSFDFPYGFLLNIRNKRVVCSIYSLSSFNLIRYPKPQQSGIGIRCNIINTWINFCFCPHHIIHQTIRIAYIQSQLFIICRKLNPRPQIKTYRRSGSVKNSIFFFRWWRLPFPGWFL